MTSAPTRIATLDVIRGVAVMGILAANIAAFGFSDVAYMSPASMAAPSLPDTMAWTTNLRGLFSVLLGASMLLVIDGARTHGDTPTLTKKPTRQNPCQRVNFVNFASAT